MAGVIKVLIQPKAKVIKVSTQGPPGVTPEELADMQAAIEQRLTQAQGDDRYWRLSTDLATQAELDGAIAAEAAGRQAADSDLQTTIAGKQNALGFTPLNPANNLSEVSNPATAKANLGLNLVPNFDPTAGIVWISPTNIQWTHTLNSNPATRPDGSALVVGDRIIDTYYGYIWIWNGTHWISEQIYKATADFINISVQTDVIVSDINLFAKFPIFIRGYAAEGDQLSANSSSNYWDLSIRQAYYNTLIANLFDTRTFVSGNNSISGVANIYYNTVSLIYAHRAVSLVIRAARIGSPPNLNLGITVDYSYARI